MRFEFATATRIIFGSGTINEVPALARSFGRRALLVIGSQQDFVTHLIDQLRDHELEVDTFSVEGEPKISTVLDGVHRARSIKAEIIIGLGGGSALDTGKAIAALVTNPGDPLDYLEVIGRGRALKHQAAPYIAIPTTAGTGSEVTRNAVLASPDHKVKVSLRSPLMLPRLAIIDPELTYSLPPSVTASTGLDALTQVIEPYTCNAPNPMTDAVCREGMMRAARSLQRAYHHGDDANAREDMSIAALFGGLALANAKLGAVHGFASPIGGLFPAPHGSICARLLPYVIEANIIALQSRATDSPVLQRYAEVAQLLTQRSTAKAEDAIGWLHDLCADLSVPPLSSFGITLDDFSTIITQAQKASSMQGNPIELNVLELREILHQSI
ncbi:MAG TPA: iron-containing alcohol dehydrogenase [Anaerolineae bacterium]|nr:iron-containing alcohol dehydrogenase [Anaerolineae bacterium]